MAEKNVDNVKINVEFSEEQELKVLNSGERLSVLMGKLAKGVKDLIAHIADNVRHVTGEERTAWNSKAAGDHTHSAVTQSAAGFMSTEDKKKLDGVAAGANAYTHPSTSGNKHIPSGGSSGQILRWSADGTAVWGADNNTTYSEMTGASASAAGTAGLVPQPTSGADVDRKYLSAAGNWNNPFNTICDEPAGMDLNDYHNGGVYYFTSSRNPKNAPVKNAGAWLMVIKEVDFFFKQIWFTAGNNPTYIRACIADGTFTDWKQVATTENISAATASINDIELAMCDLYESINKEES